MTHTCDQRLGYTSVSAEDLDIHVKARLHCHGEYGTEKTEGNDKLLFNLHTAQSEFSDYNNMVGLQSTAILYLAQMSMCDR